MGQFWARIHKFIDNPEIFFFEKEKFSCIDLLSSIKYSWIEEIIKARMNEIKRFLKFD